MDWNKQIEKLEDELKKLTACPRATLEQAMRQLEAAVNSL